MHVLEEEVENERPDRKKRGHPRKWKLNKTITKECCCGEEGGDREPLPKPCQDSNFCPLMSLNSGPGPIPVFFFFKYNL